MNKKYFLFFLVLGLYETNKSSYVTDETQNIYTKLVRSYNSFLTDDNREENKEGYLVTFENTFSNTYDKDTVDISVKSERRKIISSVKSNQTINQEIVEVAEKIEELFMEDKDLKSDIENKDEFSSRSQDSSNDEKLEDKKVFTQDKKTEECSCFMQ